MLELIAAGGGEYVEASALGLTTTAWVSLAMLVLLGVMVWKKVPALIARSLDARIAGIKAQLGEAETLRREAEALRDEYRAKLARADGEAADIRIRAETEAAALTAKAEADMTAAIARRERMAEDRIAAAEAQALADVKASAAKAAADAAAAIIARRHDAGADRALVDRAIGRIGAR